MIMAVEARQMNHLLPSHLIRDFKGNSHLLNTQMESELNFQSPVPDGLFPVYQSSVFDPVKTESGLSYHHPAAGQRKRPRDSSDGLNPAPQKAKLSGLSSLVDDDVIFQIQQHQSEIDRFVAEHSERVIMELEKRRNQETKMLVIEIYKGIAKRLREKDEEIEKMGKLNWVLQERMKSLCVENQLWRDLARTNEATANSLRLNLEQVLAQVSEERRSGGAAEEAVSSCGSTDDRREEAEVGGGNVNGAARICRKCGDKESCVLVLPCRHLCLCTTCGSAVHTCPVCKSAMNASVHVNMS